MLHGNRVLQPNVWMKDHIKWIQIRELTAETDLTCARPVNRTLAVNDVYSSISNAKVKRYVADQPAMSDYSTNKPISEHV